MGPSGTHRQQVLKVTRCRGQRSPPSVQELQTLLGAEVRDSRRCVRTTHLSLPWARKESGSGTAPVGGLVRDPGAQALEPQPTSWHSREAKGCQEPLGTGVVARASYPAPVRLPEPRVPQQEKGSGCPFESPFQEESALFPNTCCLNERSVWSSFQARKQLPETQVHSRGCFTASHLSVTFLLNLYHFTSGLPLPTRAQLSRFCPVVS